MKRIVSRLGNLNWGNRGCGVIVLLAATTIALPAQTFTTLHSFDGTDGRDPLAGLVQATNGDFYGTTSEGGALGACPLTYGCGTVFKITASGKLTTLYSFCSQSGCADGSSPLAGLVQATNGDLYGTTSGGGAYSFGTVFKMTPSGMLTTIHGFDMTDGANPVGLIQATNGDFYGTTSQGGGNSNDFYCEGNGCGAAFKITPSGTLTKLYSFCSQTNCRDGSWPSAGLAQATNGDFYGTTSNGGASAPDGTVFTITPSGMLTTLYSFYGAGGVYPFAGLVQATDGDLHGTATDGGANFGGTIFKITPSGMFTTVYSFCSQNGCGVFPHAALVQATNGDFYGTTDSGGRYDRGTVFKLSVGLAPFAGLEPRFGKVGTVVRILGQGLTGSTSVTFNGTAAVFTVVSDAEIKTSVPTGATTGKVVVVTPTGTLSSGGNFRVK
jgi:uncharacterized repeat protein (TIGR03803 family)